MTGSTSIVAACESEQLIGVNLLPIQHEVLGEVGRDEVSFAVLALARRSTKTTMSAIIGLHSCLLRPELDAFVQQGERRYSVAVATNSRQARLVVDIARAIVTRSPILSGLIESTTEDELRFRNGTAFTAFPCSSRGGRGWPIHALILDEAAHFVDSEGFQTASRVAEALIPATAQFGGLAKVIVCSTPYGSDGWFAETFQRAANGEIPGAVAYQRTTAECNPTISAEFLERERARDPESFKTEFEAQFVGSGASFLDPELIADAVADRPELPPGAVVDSVAGIDPSFSSDPFGVAIVGRDPSAPDRLILAKSYALRPRRTSSFEERRATEDEVLAEVAAELGRYGVQRVYTDQYAATSVVERLNRAGFDVESVPMTASSKTAAFSELRASLYARSIELYDQPDLISELRRLRAKYSAGSASVVTPRAGGSHCDQAQALAMAVFGMSRDVWEAPVGVRADAYSAGLYGPDGWGSWG